MKLLNWSGRHWFWEALSPFKAESHVSGLWLGWEESEDLQNSCLENLNSVEILKVDQG